jgi:hypothetical protein
MEVEREERGGFLRFREGYEGFGWVLGFGLCVGMGGGSVWVGRVKKKKRKRR